MKPRKIEYEVGKDVHGRTVLLIFEAASGHVGPSWTIKTVGSSQRDEGWIVMGLTPESILAMADAVKDSQRPGAR